MNRRELSPAGRASLNGLVESLFAGGCLKLTENKVDRFLCYRAAGEELPGFPTDEDAFGALESGIFVSVDRYVQGRNVGPKWVRYSGLDDVLYALAYLNADQEKVLELFSLQNAFRRSLDVPIDRGYIALDLSGPAPVTLEVRSRAERFRA